MFILIKKQEVFFNYKPFGSNNIKKIIIKIKFIYFRIFLLYINLYYKNYNKTLLFISNLYFYDLSLWKYNIEF